MKKLLKKIIFRLSDWNLRILIGLVGQGRFHQLIDNSTLTQILKKKSSQQQNAVYALKVYNDFANMAYRFAIRPTHVLEIGTGCSLTTLACFLANGAESATGIDIQKMDAKDSVYYLAAGDYLSVAAGFGWWRHFADQKNAQNIHYNSWTAEQFLSFVKKVNYLAPCSADNMPFSDNSFDFVYSNAALEHINQPDKTIKEIKRVLTPGGFTCHEIDLRDHGSSDPLEFLKFTESDWKTLTGKYGDGQGIERLLEGEWEGRVYCNRLTTEDWKTLFEVNGFEVLDIEPTVIVDTAGISRESYSEPYCKKSLDDLSKLVIRITAQLKH